MGDLEEANRLLGKALGELTEWRKAWVLDKTHIDASEKYILSALAKLENMEEEEALKQPPTNYGTCGCHSVPGDSKTCKVHTDRDYHFFLQGLEAGKEVMREPSAEEIERGI